MLSFFKKNKQEKPVKQGTDSTISSKELLNETGNEAPAEEVETALSLHPATNITAEQQYVLRFLNNELPPLLPNQISLAGIELQQDGGSVTVAAFVRSSLSKAVEFKKTHLLLVGPDEEILARKEFDLTEIGEIPAKSSRPWNFTFNSSDLLTDSIPAEGWKLAFEIRNNEEHRLDLDEAWENSLSSSDKEKLKQMVEQMDPPKIGEINFMGIQAKVADNEDLQVTLLIRNGNDQNVMLQQLPLQVEDATSEVIAKGGFQLDKFELKANTSKPWTFIFPKSLLLKDNPDLSSWKAYPLQQQVQTEI
ncbi:accessory Sec system S-layer assembly protein [Bacillus infantis]|uniref:accessory Sec system S-layer assembly protein n=1 Tax=Bacillus infantis TaxID=324767 RepID=UPI0039820A6A